MRRNSLRISPSWWTGPGAARSVGSAAADCSANCLMKSLRSPRI